MARPSDIKKKKKSVESASEEVVRFVNDNPNNITTALDELKKNGYDASDEFGVIIVFVDNETYEKHKDDTLSSISNIIRAAGFSGSFGMRQKK